MIELKEPVEGECVVVEADQLADLTKWEWKVLAVLPERAMVNRAQVTHGVWVSESVNGYTQQKQMWPAPEYGESHRYLLVKRPDVAMKELLDRCEQHRVEARNANLEAEKAITRTTEIEKELVDVQRQHQRALDECQLERGRYQRAHAAKSKMEEHLAKVRQAIGDIEFKKIVGE